VADAEALIPRDGRMMHPDGSAKRTDGGHGAEDFWNMHFIVAFREPFLIITQEACSCRKVLQKYWLCGHMENVLDSTILSMRLEEIIPRKSQNII